MQSDDGGDTWTASFTPDSTAMYDVVFTDYDTGYMVGAEGTVLKHAAALTSVGEPGRVASGGVRLEQNAPNPFRATTRLEFRVPRAAFVSLKVYDVAGAAVATLVEERLAPGDYARTFDGSRLASGVYTVRLSTGGAAETKRMILVR
jgi:hypothetical protein